MTEVPPPTNSLVTALLTDLYQITMAYAYWKNGRHEDPAVFELFFRKNPFGGEYTVFVGLDECLKFLYHFHFSDEDLAYLKSTPALQHCDAAFFEWLGSLDTSQVTVRSFRDGTIAFPRVPLLVVEGPLAVCQLLETTLLTLVNFPSLLATNAARMVQAAQDKNFVLSRAERDYKPHKGDQEGEEEESIPAQCRKNPACVEFGLRRAQGPDGGCTASKYASVGGFVGTSNVQAGKLFGLNISGTHAHAFVQTYSSLDQVKDNVVQRKGTEESVLILPKVLEYRKQMASLRPIYATTNEGELAAFIAYATAFPVNFLCLIDTYDTLRSGLLNFVLVALVLDDCGYKPTGVRLDSGDLAYLSMECAKTFHAFTNERPFFRDLHIVASNDINEDILHALNKQDHAITIYGIGTNLVTCQKQPALGCVFKLVEIDGKPRMKLSQDITKVLIPGRKNAFRLNGKDGAPLLDLMQSQGEPDPTPGQRILCRDPFVSRNRAAVTPSQVESLHFLVFDKGKVVPGANRSLQEASKAVKKQLAALRTDILRYSNPTPYKVSISDSLFSFLHELWQKETPIVELS